MVGLNKLKGLFQLKSVYSSVLMFHARGTKLERSLPSLIAILGNHRKIQ